MLMYLFLIDWDRSWSVSQMASVLVVVNTPSFYLYGFCVAGIALLGAMRPLHMCLAKTYMVAAHPS